MSKWFLRKKIVVILLLVIGIPLFSLVWPLFMDRALSGSLRKTYKEERNALGDLIISLGVDSSPTQVFQCMPMKTLYWQTQSLCQNFSIHKYNSNPISAIAKQNYAANAAKLDALLKDRGWLNDHPEASITSLVAINPYSEENGGLGGDVSFYKNVGPVSCNLQIYFYGTSDEASPAAIGVNMFSCQQDLSYIALNFRNWEHRGS